MASERQARGLVAQQAAQRYLEAQGMALVQSNAGFKVGEIDLIMRDGETLVFVEVRARSSARFGGALASVDATKQRKLRLAAQSWLVHQFGRRQWPACRFDVIGFDGPLNSARPLWVPNAF